MDFFFERKGLQAINTKFPYGMQHAEEMSLPGFGSTCNLPRLPEWTELDSSIFLFQERIYPFYPVLDLPAFREEARRISSVNLQCLGNQDVPLLCSIYSVIAMSADEKSRTYTALGLTFLTAAYGLVAYLSAMPYLPSVQAAVLLSVGLRSRNKDGCARQILGQAIRIAQSIGIHRNHDDFKTAPKANHYALNQHLDFQIWQTCYCLEMTMSLEVGRPTALNDADCSQIIPTGHKIGNMGGTRFLESMGGLARIQSRLIDVIYHRSPSKKNAASFLNDLGLIDQSLCDWAASIPLDIRCSGSSTCSDELCLLVMQDQTRTYAVQLRNFTSPHIYRSSTIKRLY